MNENILIFERYLAYLREQDIENDLLDWAFDILDEIENFTLKYYPQINTELRNQSEWINKAMTTLTVGQFIDYLNEKPEDERKQSNLLGTIQNQLSDKDSFNPPVQTQNIVEIIFKTIPDFILYVKQNPKLIDVVGNKFQQVSAQDFKQIPIGYYHYFINQYAE